MSEYETDILTWSERQAGLLRRRAAGELINDGDLDWSNLAEEIEAVGQSQVDAVESWLYQALLHMLKAEAWPLSPAVPYWQAEGRGFRAQARRRYRPSMRQKLDIPALYADALYAMPDTIDGQAPLPAPTECPVTLDELLGALWPGRTSPKIRRVGRQATPPEQRTDHRCQRSSTSPRIWPDTSKEKPPGAKRRRCGGRNRGQINRTSPDRGTAPHAAMV